MFLLCFSCLKLDTITISINFIILFKCIYSLKVCCLKATLYHNGQIETFDIFMKKKIKDLLKTPIYLTKHLNKHIYQVFNELHISYLIKINFYYPAVALRQHCTIVERKFYKPSYQVIISKYYSRCCFRVKH